MTTHDAFDNRFLAEFGDPFDTIEGLAQYLVHPDNPAPAYTAIRNTIITQLSHTGDIYWSVEIIEMVSNLPDCRALMVNVPTQTQRWALAVDILNTALAYLDGDPNGDDLEESGK